MERAEDTDHQVSINFHLLSISSKIKVHNFKRTAFWRLRLVPGLRSWLLKTPANSYASFSWTSEIRDGEFFCPVAGQTQRALALLSLSGALLLGEMSLSSFVSVG